MANGSSLAPSHSSTLRFTLYAAVIAGFGVFLVYVGAFDVGFYYDDYHFARPWSPHELRRVWLWSWDPAGIEPKFFRPLSAWLFAGRFWLLGLNSTAIHTVSLLGHILCAVLAASFLRREGGATTTALFGAWLYAIHPSFPYAQVSWATNQMHMAESIVVLTALLYWQHVRHRPFVWWTPLGGWAVAAFLFKEDGIMLLPAILVLIVIREWLEGERTWGRWIALASAGAVIVMALVAFRQSKLGSLGGYSLPTGAMAITNFWKGLDETLLLWPTRSPWQAVASTIAAVTIVGALFVAGRKRDRRWETAAALGAVAILAFAFPAYSFPRPYALVTWQGIASGAALSFVLAGIGVSMWRRNTRAAWLIAAGLAIASSFDLPFLLVSKREQYHLLTLGAVITYAGAIEALTRAVSRRESLLIAACVAFTVPFIFLARIQARDFLPCSPMVLEADTDVRGWGVVPDQTKTWFEAKARACRDRQPIPPLVKTEIQWGVYEEQSDETGRSFRWTSDHATLMMSAKTAAIVVDLRRLDATSQRPVHVTVLGGRQPLSLSLTTNEWTYGTVRFDAGLLSWLRNGRRVDVVVDQSFVPALVDPKSSDLRRHGVELRIPKEQG